MFGRLFEFAFPNSYHTIATCFHVCVLRLVERCAFGLAMVEGVKLCWVSVPVVAIKLNHRVYRGDKSVNTEFVPNEVLSFIRHTDTIENGIRSTLKIVRFHTELFGIHAAQVQSAFRVFISALDRAIGDVVLSAFTTRWRPIESVAAYFASVFRLIATLPFVGAFNRTKSVFVCSRIKRNAADFARNISTSFALRFGRTAVALKSAIILIGAQMTCSNFATTFACNGANRVFAHKCILPQLGQND